MTSIESSRLLLMRIQKAIGLINRLREENKELEERLTLVLMHNSELQELLEKVSADQSAIDEAISTAINDLDATIGDIQDFGATDASELQNAEDFSVSGLDGTGIDDIQIDDIG